MPSEVQPPPGARISTVVHRVAFYETDAMGIVHHSNYVRFLELARIAWLDEHDRPYRAWVDDGYHIATTALELRYRAPARYDDRIAVRTWLAWMGGVSLGMGYRLESEAGLVAFGSTEHAVVDSGGRLRRPPRERVRALRELAVAPPPPRRPR